MQPDQAVQWTPLNMTVAMGVFMGIVAIAVLAAMGMLMLRDARRSAVIDTIVKTLDEIKITIRDLWNRWEKGDCQKHAERLMVLEHEVGNCTGRLAALEKRE